MIMCLHFLDSEGWYVRIRNFSILVNNGYG